MKEDKNTKEKIFEAAVDLFSKKGYEGSSMRDLAKEVGIKESSLYYHYPSKSSILEAIQNYYIDGFKESVPDRGVAEELVKNFNDPVEFWLFGMAEYFERQPELMEAVANIMLNEMYLDDECRKFVLHNMFTVQKEATVILLTALYEKGLIKNCDIVLTAEQYVYMIHGLDVETRLLKKEGYSQDVIDETLIKHITYFVEGLKN